MEKKKKKLHERMWFWILLVFLLSFAWRGLMNIADTVPEDREYTEVTVDQLFEEFNDNPLKAKDTYTDAFVALKGCVRVIDSDGESITLYPIEYESIDGVNCTLKSDEQREVIKEHSKGDIITVKGKITEVDGIWAYTLDIDSIE